MSFKKGHADEVMFSLFTKEATYNAGVTMNDSNACSMKGFELEVPPWPDVVATDKDTVTGREHGTDQEIIEKRVSLTYREPRAKPNSLAGFGSLVLGSSTPTQDGGLTAYRHRIVPVAVGSDLPSIQGEPKTAGLQYAYKGIRGQSLEISAEAGAPVSFSVELMGSGTRATSATAMAAAITESWLLANQCKVWKESGGDITIAATPTQGTEDISSATPDDLKLYLQSFTFRWNNNLQEVPGFGGAGVLQEIDYGQRSAELTMTMIYNDATELNHYINQDVLAIELDLASTTLIAAGGTFYYGAQIVIPRLKLKTPPLPVGGPSEFKTAELSFEIFENGTNPAVILDVYTAKAAYVA